MFINEYQNNNDDKDNGRLFNLILRWHSSWNYMASEKQVIARTIAFSVVSCLKVSSEENKVNENYNNTQEYIYIIILLVYISRKIYSIHHIYIILIIENMKHIYI